MLKYEKLLNYSQCHIKEYIARAHEMSSLNLLKNL